MSVKTKKRKTVVTDKIKKLVHLNLENCKRRKPKTKQQLVVEAGYSPRTYPYKIEKYEGYKQYFTEIIKNKDLTKIHSDLLDAKEIKKEYFDVDIEDEEIIDIVESSCAIVKKIKVVDVPFQGLKKVCYYIKQVYDVRGRALDQAYKVIGGYAPEKKELKTFDMAELHKQIYGDNPTGQSAVADAELIQD